ncbi:NAD(P)-dependent malic enzyme [Glycomyces niveus]|uniref:NADP-dependent malic enzyme n=1 Tax=Glycomyces niveus TaxID=2820287 RepID=A0ABS3U389_9ACTN|nr:NADP-dependent malic enzyme [Glycomyces sp. NEAU-S30]MBO3733242.1 NADP-dependent malic enzyme [Glycomyces sp. NEAU-S30]
MIDLQDPIFVAHEGGKLRTSTTVPLDSREDLSVAYTPGVARVCEAIAADESLARTHTWRSNVVAVVTDGTAVLGLGDIGPAASLPVMEGKAALFRQFADVDAVPICLDTKDPDAIVAAVAAIAPSFGGINLEDIAAPRCFEIEDRLKALLDIPVFHDDQHGTAVVVLAALTNAMRLQDRRAEDLTVAVVGAGAAGVAITKILGEAGVGDLIVCDSTGIIYEGRDRLNPVKAQLAASTNRSGRSGGITEALKGADVLVGVSGGSIPESALEGMADNAIVFALANPTPEVAPETAAKHAAIVATGRSDYPNQINNVLAFPGIFRGALDAGAPRITEAMKLAAAHAIADIAAADLAADRIVPSPLDPRVAPAVAAAVHAAA